LPVKHLWYCIYNRKLGCLGGRSWWRRQWGADNRRFSWGGSVLWWSRIYCMYLR